MQVSPSAPPAAKAQLVGWQPMWNYRKNTLAASASKSKVPAEEAASRGGPMYVKVSMDGTPYLRKVDVKMYSTYEDLSMSMALEKMFSCFITGQSGLHKSSRKDRLTNGSKVDALKDQDYVLTYEDKDADWMLVSDLSEEHRVLSWMYEQYIILNRYTDFYLDPVWPPIVLYCKHSVRLKYKTVLRKLVTIMTSNLGMISLQCQLKELKYVCSSLRWLCSYYCTCLAWCSMNKIQKKYTALGLLRAL